MVTTHQCRSQTHGLLLAQQRESLSKLAQQWCSGAPLRDQSSGCIKHAWATMCTFVLYFCGIEKKIYYVAHIIFYVWW